MAITQSQAKNSASVLQMVVGNYITSAAAAAITITVGFQAKYVKVVNETDRIEMEWYEGMADAEGIKTIANGTRSIITSNGITVAAKTFIIGLDTALNVTNKQLSWVVFG